MKCCKCLDEKRVNPNDAYSAGVCQEHRYKGATRNYDQERRHVEMAVNQACPSYVKDSARALIVHKATVAYFMGAPDALHLPLERRKSKDTEPDPTRTKRQSNGTVQLASIPVDRCDRNQEAMIAVIDAELALIVALHSPQTIIARNVVVKGKPKDIFPDDRLWIGDEVTVAQDETIRALGLTVRYSDRKGQFYVSIPRQFNRKEIQKKIKNAV